MKTFLFGACALAIMGLTACDSGSSEEYFGRLHDQNGNLLTEVLLYADQASTDFYISTSDTWTTTSQLDWATVTPTAFTTPYYSTKVTVTPTSPNTTSKVRSGLLTFNLSEHKLSTIVYQSPWHNITAPSINSNNKFEMQLNVPDSAAAPVMFTTYQDGGTLKSSDPWVHVDTTFAAGAHTIIVRFGKNTGAARTATISLTSGGVSTPIIVSQPKKRDN